MKKRSVLLSVVLLLLMLATSTCIDSFKPKLKDYQPFLVVEALVTDEEASNYVTISRTIEDPYDKPEKVTEATVEIKDDLGNITTLDEVSKGKYRTDSLTFRGMPGRSYTLYIRTKEGREFESEPCILNEGRDIDSMYFTRGSHPVDGGIVNVPGADLFIDSKGPSDSKYFRWTYEEWWKFRTPNPKTHEYINSRNIIEIPLRNVTCWKKNSSGEIIIQSTDEGTSGEFVKKPVLFVPAEKSDRLLIQYSIHLKQYAISKREYEFWQQMKMITESGGDIFDKQPFRVIGNIHSITGQQIIFWVFSRWQVSKRSNYTLQEAKSTR